jgi:type IV secretion system protein VirD4
MSPSKILIGQFLIVLSIIGLTMWISTQWVAHTLGYQPALGKVWFSWNDWPIYKPWRIFQWWYAYEAYAPSVFARGGLIAASGGLLGILAAVIGSVWRSRWERRVTTFGSARWGSKSDLIDAGLLKTEGVFLGRWKKQYIRHDGPEHVLAFAPTRSGKGVGLVIPTLLSWTGSAVIHDIKGENWSLTSGWRASFSNCVKFDPTDLSSARFNPLMEVRKGASEVRDVQNIADILVDPEGTLERRNHWEKTAHSLLVGVILHVLYAQEDKTLSGCARFLSDPSRTFEKTLNNMLSAKHIVLPNGTREVHPIVAQAARELLNKSENERSGVLSTALSFLGLYRDPVIGKITAASDWRIGDLITGDRPISLYLVVPPSDLSRTKPLIRLILNQIGRRLTETMPEPGRRKILLMLDEFPALGRLDFFESALAFMAGYGVRAYLIAQSLNQIEKAYGPNHAILDNCHVRIAFSTNDERTAKRISEALGTKTQLRSQKNYTGHRLAPWLSHMMVSRQETQRALMTPGEVMQMPPSDEIVMVSGCLPFLAKKLRYFEDRNFAERILSPPKDPLRLQSARANWPEREDPVPSVNESLGPKGEDGGQEINPTLGSPEQTRSIERDTDAPPEFEDSEDVDAAQTLETLRQAATLDLADDNTLPEF